MKKNKQVVLKSYNERVLNVVDTECFLVSVSNYGDKKSCFNFYTPSEGYAQVKKQIVLKLSPGAVVIISRGKIIFQPLEV